MYVASVVVLLFVAPVISILIGVAYGGALLPLATKWFVFWPVGVRLFIGGLRQVFQPAFTAEQIFKIKDPSAQAIVREIGFGNLSMGALGLLSLIRPEWTIPAAIVGGLYYGLAGAGHLTHPDRSVKEQVAMVTDLAIFAVLAILVALYLKGAA